MMRAIRVRRAASRAGVAGLALAAALALACGRKVTAPIETPPTPPPAVVEAVYPPARATLVIYDTPVWVQFALAVDTSTVNARTVFFKDETRRIPSALTWDPATRRLTIVPDEPLRLRQTYTVELSRDIRFADESVLGENYLWQFTINSLRRIESPTPMDDQTYESPFCALRWQGTIDPGVGPVTYELHASTDSAQAADPNGTPLAILTAPEFVPHSRWAQDRPNYWSIHALNIQTGERLVGPVWRFSTFPADAPYDSIPAPVLDWDWVERAPIIRQRCTEDSIAMSPNITSTIRWDLGPPDTTVRLAKVAIELSPRYAAHTAVAIPSVWAAANDWVHCVQFPDGPPFPDEVFGKLADCMVVSPTRIRFSSDTLAAHVEATRRLGGRHGYLFRSGLRRTYFGPGAGNVNVRAVMWLYIYRPPPAPLAARRPRG
ncbi:MAG TPA: Ig-like domain-containing protein [Candidatus Eisenbacteria bacterium]|nr:Ig-like domain-containing protein [Candidatus Eisenbacteria bacterium]